MNKKTTPGAIDRTTSPDRRRRSWRYALVPWLVVVLTSLACGSFVPRPTPVPRPTATPIVEVAQAAAPSVTPTLDLPTSVPTRDAPTPTFTPTPAPGTAIIVGQPARVVASQGLNVRKTAGASGDRTGRYPPGAIVSVLEGPIDADGYLWNAQWGAGRVACGAGVLSLGVGRCRSQSL